MSQNLIDDESTLVELMDWAKVGPNLWHCMLSLGKFIFYPIFIILGK